jgi:hydroxymethylpyrimidine/phosphomethylpyrimidine kinase
LHDDALDALRALIAQARLVTPNLPEAAALIGAEEAHDEEAMYAQAQKLLALGAGAVLIKGGHGSGPQSIDLLVEGTSRTRFAAPRIATRNTHGTGCTQSPPGLPRIFRLRTRWAKPRPMSRPRSRRLINSK